MEARGSTTKQVTQDNHGKMSCVQLPVSTQSHGGHFHCPSWLGGKDFRPPRQRHPLPNPSWCQHWLLHLPWQFTARCSAVPAWSMQDHDTSPVNTETGSIHQTPWGLQQGCLLLVSHSNSWSWAGQAYSPQWCTQTLEETLRMTQQPHKNALYHTVVLMLITWNLLFITI